MDLLSDDSLNSMIRGEPVGDQWPYAGGSKRDIAKHLKKVVSKLKRLPGVAVEAEFRHYGSGYASYVDVFCYPRNGSSQQKRDGVLHIVGLSVYLSRLAPLAVLGSGEKTRFKSGGGYSFLEASTVTSILLALFPRVRGGCSFLAASTVDSVPDGDWLGFVQGIRTKINDCGFTFLDRETVLQPLPFEADIPTILSEPPYNNFDAVFYWED